MGLKVGGFKKTEEGVTPDLDFSKPEEGSEEVTTTETEIVAPEVTEEVKPDETIENKATEEVVVKDETPLTPEVPEEVKPKVEITDEAALSYLSGKLGREIQSFDELSKSEESLITDPELKAAYEWKQKTNGRPLEDFFKFQKDYKSLPDLDVAREYLQYEYPELTDDEISLELRKYTPSDDDYDDDVAVKKLELKKLATKGRNVLSQVVSELQKPMEPNLPPELKQDLEIAKQYKEAVKNQETVQKQYTEAITNQALNTDKFELPLTDNLKIDYKLTDEDKKSLPELIETMPHWRNEDGSWNHQAVVNDAIKIQHFDKMLKLAYEQGVNAGTENLIKDTKNVTMKENTPNDVMVKDAGKGVQIEGFEDFVGKRGMKIRSRK